MGVKTCKAPKSVPSISTIKSASAPVRSVVEYREENPKPSSKKKENWSGSPPAKFSVRSRVKLIVVPRVIGCKSSLKKPPSAMVTVPGSAPVTGPPNDEGFFNELLQSAKIRPVDIDDKERVCSREISGRIQGGKPEAIEQEKGELVWKPPGKVLGQVEGKADRRAEGDRLQEFVEETTPPTRGGERCVCPVPILYTQRALQALWQKGATCRVQERALPSGLPQEWLWG